MFLQREPLYVFGWFFNDSQDQFNVCTLKLLDPGNWGKAKESSPGRCSSGEWPPCCRHRRSVSELYLLKLLIISLANVFFYIAKYICSNCQMYLSELLNIFVWIAKCIYLYLALVLESYQIYAAGAVGAHQYSKHISKCKIYLSK